MQDAYYPPILLTHPHQHVTVIPSCLVATPSVLLHRVGTSERRWIRFDINTCHHLHYQILPWQPESQMHQDHTTPELLDGAARLQSHPHSRDHSSNGADGGRLIQPPSYGVGVFAIGNLPCGRKRKLVPHPVSNHSALWTSPPTLVSKSEAAETAVAHDSDPVLSGWIGWEKKEGEE